MHLKIRTYVLCSSLLMLLLIAGVAGVAVQRTAEIGKLAGDLNDRVVNKTRIAADIVTLGQQLRFADAFLLRADDARQDELARDMIERRNASIDGRIASYLPLVDSDLERSLLRNLQRSRSAYLALQTGYLSLPLLDRPAKAAAADDELETAFAQANRQATGLSHLAETEARAARERALTLASGARTAVILASGLACAVGLMIVALLALGVFRPLAQITRALLDLADGRLDVSLFPRRRGGEIDAMVRAIEVFRSSAIALATANSDLKAAHSQADSLARHDALTGLPNRRVLSSTITDAIARSRRRGLHCGVLVLDLDRFKPVNDIYGHAAGDKVLCQVAERLRSAVRSDETAARLGGDEFAVVIEFDPATDAATRLAKRIVAGVTAPMLIEGRAVSVGVSIGISLWPGDGDDAETLLHAADLAMFKAKHDERGSFRFFEREMDIQLRARADLETRLHHAIERGDIRPHFQPLMNIRENRIVGFEILARWHDGEEVRPPSEFIQIAEEAGLISSLTYSVLRQACRHAQTWPESLVLALNITPAQISDSCLPGALLAVLAEENFPPTRLEVEITENALIGDITAAKAVIAELRRNGVLVSLDDFGTGYSSLHHLRDLKFDKIKIDRSFVQSMLHNTEASTIVETVLGLGRSLGVYTIAEGIEDGEHLRSLLGKGCEFGQGYHFGKPIGAAEVPELLASRGAPLGRAA